MMDYSPYLGLSLNSLNHFTLLISITDFYNWNRVKIRYCDGASFTGNMEAVDTVNNHLIWFISLVFAFIYVYLSVIFYVLVID